ncbi:MAG: M10 family metallopeptidase C-terminal domain-containing protein [Hyphomicrobiaceae bacterium]
MAVSSNVPVQLQNPYVDSLVTDWRWANEEGVTGTQVQISYYFTNTQTADPWTPEEISRFEQAFRVIESVANVRFHPVTDIADANLVEYKRTDPGAFHQYPLADQVEGKFDSTHPEWTLTSLDPGGGMFSTVLHELGHAMGLAHTWEASEGATVWPGLYDPNAPTSGPLADTPYNSVMTYNGDPVVMAPGRTADWGNIASMMAVDIAALQAMYGANTTYNSGDNIYTLPDANTFGTGWTSIWDTGGIDRIVYDGTRDATIDLRAATFDPNVPGGELSFADGVVGGFSIARGVIIEDAFGGAGGDVIYGNEFGNILHGRDGVDHIHGGQSADYIDGGRDTDYLYGDEGADTIFGGADRDGVYGDKDYIFGGAGNDTLYGGGGNDAIYGDSDNDTIYGGSGADELYGDDGTDTLRGESGNDFLRGGIGPDTLIGGANTDTADYGDSTVGVTVNLTTGQGFYGTAQGDTLSEIENVTGSRHADTLIGDAGANELRGDYGDDTLVGLGGADTFGGGEGFDTVTYAASGSGVDVRIFAGGVVEEFRGHGGDAEGDIIEYDVERIIGSAYDDIIRGDPYTNRDRTFEGGAGRDQLVGGIGNDTLRGDGDDDWLEGGKGADTLVGGANTDTAVYRNSDEGVTVNLLAGTGSGGEAEGDTLSGIENIAGSGLGDTLTGDHGANAFDGWTGDDTFAGLGGADTFYGGDGIDTVTYAASNAGVTVSLYFGGATTPYLGQGGHAAGDLVYADVERIIGSGYDDVISTSANDTVGREFDGGSGRDNLTGGAGEDTLRGGSGNDELYGGAARDELFGGANDDLLVGGEGDDVLHGESGNDRFVGGAGRDQNFGGIGLDTVDYGGHEIPEKVGDAVGVHVSLAANLGLHGDAEGDTYSQIENLIGTAADDILIGDGMDNHLVGTMGNDILAGGAGTDILDGGSDIDTADYSGETGAVNVFLSDVQDHGGDIGFASKVTGSTSGTDYLKSIENVIGGTAADVLSGDAGANRLEGRGGSDRIAGLAGDDTLSGGADSDILDGGADIDTADYSGETGAVNVFLFNVANFGGDIGLASLTAGVTSGSDYLKSIENVIGGAAADVLYGDAGANRLEGRGGSDRIDGREGNDMLYGDAGADLITGGAGDDTIYGGADTDTFLLGESGMDTIHGGDGDDRIDGGADDDKLHGDDGADRITGGLGDDTIYGGEGDDQFLLGEAGSDIIYGGLGVDFIGGGVDDDFLYGEGGNDAIMGGLGNDTIEGGADDDTLYGEDGADTIRGGDGSDRIAGGNDSDTLLAGDAGNDTIFGGAGDDTIDGGADNDVLYGEAGNDTISGGAGSDQIYSGGDNDTIDGGGDADYILAGLGNDVIDGGMGNDTIFGEGGTDTFKFADDWGHDTIRDWLNGTEKLDVSGVTGLDNFGQLTIYNIAGGVQVYFGGNTITLSGWNTTHIDASDFIF